MATWTWTGSVNDDYNNAGNWNPASVPTNGAANSISVAAGSTIDFNTTGVSLDNLTITGTGTVTFEGDPVTFRGDLNVGTGQTLVLTGGISVTAGGESGASGTVTLNGATLDLTGYPSFNGTINFASGSASANILEIPDYESNLGKITNFGAGDEIATNESGATIALVSNGNGTYTLSETHGTHTHTISSDVTLAAGYTPSSFTSGDGNFGVGVCFLAGSMIETLDGATAVETIVAGDQLAAGIPKGQAPHQVVWVGHQDIVVTSEDDFPVRIMAGAFADGVPAQDLLITQEHSMFFDGKLVPARMLVNGRNVVLDRSQTAFRIYHIETAAHSIILANGAPTESYLDTGNRKNFTAKRGSVLRFAKNWVNDSVAPLATDRATVEPIFRAIEARAIAQGLANAAPEAALTTDADLHLITESGLAVRAVRVENDAHVFMLPAGTKNVSIVSRVFVPSQIEGAFVDDRRELGVKVGAIAQNQAVITAHLTEALAGWHGVEEGATRWTNGNALLPLVASVGNLSIMLTMQVETAFYRQDCSPADAVRRQA